MNDRASELLRTIPGLIEEDLPSIPTFTHSVFGQRIALLDENEEWTEEIRFEHIGYTTRRLPWGERFNENGYLEWLFRLWMIERIETSVDVHPIMELIGIIAKVRAYELEAEHVASELLSHLSALVPALAEAGREAALLGIRSLLAWAFEAGLPGFDDQFAEFLSLTGRSRYSWVGPIVALRDPNQGPYTASEMRALNHAITNSMSLSARHRALCLVARDWGLRPIQLALLRTEDFGEDPVGPFVMVPSVKGSVRSKLRRATGNMVRRHIADDTANAILCQIDAATEGCAPLVRRIERLMLMYGRSDPPPTPLFPCGSRHDERLERYCADSAIYEYAFHSDSVSISREFRRLTDVLAIPCERHDPRNSATRNLQISAYRLRRTKGTTLVLAGHTADEVAEALDHISTDTVSHYFKYSQDLHRFINETAASSHEIANAVDGWEGKLVQLSMQQGSASVARVGSLGLCTRGSPCPYHPTVTCYACQSFRPDINADHEASLKSIEAIKLQLNDSSTGPLKTQLEAEVNGALAIVGLVLKMRNEGGE
ncbi:phage integrase family protein [Stenotrophomonas maltophilia]|uniref:phage integrase family protein n=1 Tax=Stenotrophomonas maltophilia TaxID=40324 RepID=UPI001180F666|nr:phage integrase family protein [Stenotrophomonas maltophilia]